MHERGANVTRSKGGAKGIPMNGEQFEFVTRRASVATESAQIRPGER